MNQFVNRIANYVANEIIIKGLANSRTFQRFAVRTDKSLQDLHQTGTETFGKAVDEIGRNVSTNSRVGTGSGAAAAAAAGPPQPPLRGFPGFVSAFFKELRKDFIGAGR